MILSSDYRYVALDFETTGLNLAKDEPIQVGLVRCDAQGQFIDSYVSYIKPEKKRSDLKDVVSVITGLSLDDVMQGQSRADVEQQLAAFFDEKTVVIGHNVSFDVSFLRNYFPSISFAFALDTYPLSQACVHYVGSFALETLAQKLSTKQPFAQDLEVLQESIYGHTDTEKFHDALYDSVLTMVLFFYCMYRLGFLFGKYPEISSCFFKLDEALSLVSCFELSPSFSSQDAYVATLPLLTKPVGLGNQVPVQSLEHCSLDDQEFGQGNYIGDMKLSEVVSRVVAGNKVILAVSHRQKLDIVKRLLLQLGYTDLGYLKQEQVIDLERMRQFLSKKTFSREEFLFVCKWCSHHEQGLRVLEVTNATDASLMYFFQKTSAKIEKDIVLTTHGGLYAMLEDKERRRQYENHYFCFFDADWRYSSYNNFVNAQFDLYTLLDAIERVQYTYQLLSEQQASYKQAAEVMNRLTSLFTLFVGVFCLEATEQFTGNAQDKLVFHDLSDNYLFRRTGMLWYRIRTLFVQVEQLLLPEHVRYLLGFFKKLADLFAGVVSIQRRIYGFDGLYYTIAFDVSYTDYSEFLVFFAGTKLRLFSHFNTQYKALSQTLSLPADFVPQTYALARHGLVRLTDPGKVCQFVADTLSSGGQDIFVLSAVKHRSQALVSRLRSAGQHKDMLILAENITGGVKKNVVKAQVKKPKVIVGGYTFLLALLASGWKFDKCVLFHIMGALEKVIVRDIMRYRGS